jgi:parallel beta-helix repeat protein
LLPVLHMIASAVRQSLLRIAGLRGKRWAAIAFAWVAAAASLPSAAVAEPPSVSFLGPTGRIVGPTTLKANAASDSGRIVAVTFLLDGVPLGSDTTAPYALYVNPGLFQPGRHRLRVEAVDNFGRRRSTGPITLSTARFRAKVLTASPRRGLRRALAALHDGGVTVRLGPGRYRLHEIELGDGARLRGAGRGTIISAPRRTSYWALLIAKGRNIDISDLTLDGGGPGRGAGIGVAVFDGSRNVRLRRLHLIHVRTYGVNVWGSHADISVQDSQIESDGNGDAGVFALGSDRSRDTSVIRTRIRGFRSHGILLAQTKYGRPAAALHGLALDNVISDIRDPARDACTYAPHTAPKCGTNEGGIWTGGVEAAIIGNTIRRARWDGIETVGSSTRTTVVGNQISNTRTGIYLEHSTNDSLFSRNLIVDARTAINVEWWHEGVGSSRNMFTFNRIVSARRYGLFVDVDDDGNQIIGNTFVGGIRPAIVLQGSSMNVVRGNHGCRGNGGSLVREQAGNRDGGGRAEPKKNQLVDNTVSRSCRAR